MVTCFVFAVTHCAGIPLLRGMDLQYTSTQTEAPAEQPISQAVHSDQKVEGGKAVGLIKAALVLLDSLIGCSDVAGGKRHVAILLRTTAGTEEQARTAELQMS